MTRVDERKTLLVIDDEPDIIEVIFGLLDDATVRILLALNGREALEVLKKESIDAILTDVRMPHMGGIEMVKAVRALGLATPVLVMSGYLDQKTVLEALRAGVLDVVEKPFAREKMQAAVGHALELGANVRRIHSELRVFCENREIDEKYVDIMKYLSIFLAQQELERVKREGMKTAA